MKSKLPNDGIYAVNPKNNEVIEVNKARLISLLRAEVKGVPEDHAKHYLKVIEGGDDIDTDGIEDPEYKKAVKAFVKAAEKAIDFHFEHEQELAKAAEKAEAAKRKENQQIALAGVAGQKSGELFIDVGTDGLQAMVKRASGGHFEASATGLTIKGAVKDVTKKDIAQLIGALASSSESVDVVRSQVLWNLGDAVLFAKSNFDNGEEIVEQVASTHGKSKHTIQQAVRLAEHFAPDERRPELTFTHHQEMFNYREAVPKGKMGKIIDVVLAGEPEFSVEKSNGEKEVITKPLSCNKMRAMLREAAGTGSGGGGGGGGRASTNFLYIGRNDGAVYSHDAMIPDAAAEYQIIDLGGGKFYDSKGKVEGKIVKLDTKQFENPEPKKEGAPKKPKGKKGSQQEQESADIPE